MIMPILFGLLAAFTWGAADFNGGIATKKVNAYSVIAVSHILSLGLLSLLIAVYGEGVPPLQDWLWGIAAGFSGSIGLLFLYRALAEGRMSIAAPISGVIAALLPVLVSALIEGIPSRWMLPGLALGLVSIWLVSGGEGITIPFDELRQPLAAGASFGVFLICLNRASETSLLWPLVVMRLVSIPTMLGYAVVTRQDWRPISRNIMPIVLSSVLDTIGNASFALSARLGRLDVASVLASLYPGATVVLAWIFLRERLSRNQWIGIVSALSAIVLLTV